MVTIQSRSPTTTSSAQNGAAIINISEPPPNDSFSQCAIVLSAGGNLHHWLQPDATIESGEPNSRRISRRKIGLVALDRAVQW